MIQAKIVLGTIFGDEGKGITTDYLCSKTTDKTIVVRFSGGQQAGHNVEIDGVSHIHASYGSGTLRGVPSYFSEHCTFSPANMLIEHRILEIKGITPEHYIHPLAMITTPGDVAYNRVMEKKLGHGSCGMGIGATMERNLNTGYKLYAIDLNNENLLLAKLTNIRDYYRNKIKKHDREYFDDIYGDNFTVFIKAIRKLKFNIQDYNFLKQYETIIFEGSQGILLDMNHGIFPNVTYANTTSKNALEICEKLKINKSFIDIYYITRCYQTRHGNGWMSNTTPIEIINNEKEINVFNEWQKEFKICEIDYNLISHSIDIDKIYSGLIPNKHLVVTCMDQRPDFKFERDKFIDKITSIHYSYSPESKDFKSSRRKGHFGNPYWSDWE